MSLLRLPYSNLHELNLDWIIEQLNQEGAVLSVNGKHGTVTLTGEDINRTPNNQQTVEQALTAQGSSIQAARSLLGTTPLPTTAQTVTGAVDELSGDIGDINEKIGNTALPTTAQTLTGATAELDGDVTTINNKIGNTTLPTTAQTITGAIAEHESDITTINNKIGSTVLPTTAQTLTGATAELDGDVTTINNKIGTTTLPTTAQTITGAIAEHESDITSINSNITTINNKVNRQNVGVTLNNIGNTYFTHAATHGSMINGLYCVSFNVNTKVELPTTELNVGDVSFSPQWTVTGYMVVNNSTAFAGTVQITSSGAIYIRAAETIPANRDIIITVVGTYY